MIEQHPYSLFPEAEYDRMMRLSQQKDPRLMEAAQSELWRRYKHYESQYNPEPSPTYRLAGFMGKLSFFMGVSMAFAGVSEKDPYRMQDSALFFLLGGACRKLRRAISAKVETDYSRVMAIRDLLLNSKGLEER